MTLKTIASYVKDHGLRASAVLTADRLLGRQAPEVSYDQWLYRNRPSSRDYQRMEKESLPASPLIGVTASMSPQERTAFFQSLDMQVYRNFRALKNCPEPDYILIVNGSCTLRPDFLWECASLLTGEGGDEIDLIYTDSDRIGEDGRKGNPAFRPSFDPELLENVNYMGNCVLVKTGIAKAAGISQGREEAFHAFLKRVCLREGMSWPSSGRRIRHIPKILYHTVGANAAPDGGKDAGRLPLEEVSSEMNQPLISVLIPNRDHGEDLERCIESLRTVNTWKNLEVLILENNSTEEKTEALYRSLTREDPRIRVLRWEGAFNYSAINNFGAQKAAGEYLLLLNNDTQVLDPESLSRMAALCQRPDVGAAGALLLYPDGTIQHAGIILGHGGIAGHAWEGGRRTEEMDDFQLLMVSNPHNVSAVTGACMMIRSQTWEMAGGMDESLAVTFNDVDLCMRLRERGLKVLMCPQACLFHYESATRGSEDTREKVERFHREIGIFVNRWKEALEKGDPFYNPNLTLLGRSYTCRDDLRESVKPYLKYLKLFGAS